MTPLNLGVVGMLVVLLPALVTAQFYSSKYDNIDLDEILNNQRLYSKYLDCLKGGKCTPEGKELRDILPEALRTKCGKCSPHQRQGAEKVLKFVYEKRPQDFDDLEKIYDPEGTFRQKYKEDAERLGIKV